MRSHMPSSMAAVPYTAPDCMESLELPPMTLAGVSRLMRGSREAREIKESKEV